MLLRKILVTSLTVAAISLPTIALADLDTYNYTDEDSSVKITNDPLGYNVCSYKLGQYTPKRPDASSYSFKHVPESAVRAVCDRMLIGGVCEADIYATKDCNGNVVAKASLNLDTNTVTVINVPQPSGKQYNITASGSRVEIHYAS